MATCAELQTRLAEAEAALHAALMGKNVSMQRQGEKQLQFATLSLPELQKYVLNLRDQVAACTGDNTRKRRRVIGVIPVDNNRTRWPRIF